MATRITYIRRMATCLVGLVLALSVRTGQADEREQARAILEATGVKGGLIVHLGCGDGKLTAALRANDGYLVHGLDADPEHIEKARQHIRSLDLYGKVSVEPVSGDPAKAGLPYIDNLVNLLICEELGEIPMDEVMRVLAPNGVAYIKKEGKWTKTVKPRPKEIDEWTHYLHDASNNAVAHDSVVGPPRHQQWVGSPRWARHHDRMASVSVAVSTNGLVFYIFDEGPTAAIMLPSKWSLIARDAFSGVILWKRPIPTWNTRFWPMKSGPAQIPRRLVAIEDRVYVPLGLDAPLTCLDASTGETIRTYDGTKNTEEIIFSDGVLFLLVNEAKSKWSEYRPVHRNMGQAIGRVAREWAWDEEQRWIVAVQAETGEGLWKKDHKVVPLTLAADTKCVYFHDGEKIVCLNRKDGEEVWRSEPVSKRSPVPVSFGPTLVVYEDVVLFSGGDRTMAALSAKTGEKLWTAEHPRSGHFSPEDLLVVDGLAWSGEIASGRDSGIFKGRDPHTGEVVSEFAPDVDIFFMHHRCYRSKATDRYIIPSWTGIEFVDVRNKHWITNHWVRGGCLYGIVPCNGLIYAPPHSCACYMEAKLNGFNALAPESPSRQVPKEVPDEGRLERGPVYSEEIRIPESAIGDQDWPTYRHDPARSGFTKASVPSDLKYVWQTELGGTLSSPVIADGKVFLAKVDMQTVYALDANSGKILWSYTAGGRVDSPPTIWQGRVLFGSADGCVYCLRGSDGTLVWRFRCAPEARRLVAFEQVESVWPVPGSVLIQDDVLYCVAGRSMFLDGGIRLLRLDPKTGRKLSETVLDERDPVTGENLQSKIEVRSMPVALPDILSSDGKYVYMRSQQFDLEGKRPEVVTANIENVAQQNVGEAHLFCPAGFLDGAWNHRVYWMFGRKFLAGAEYPTTGRYVPAGRLLVCDGSSIYGFGRKPEYFTWTTPLEYHLFATSKDPVPAKLWKPPKPAKGRRRGPRWLPAAGRVYQWSREAPLQVRAMVLAGSRNAGLFVAGPPDVVDEERAFYRPDDDGVRANLDEQSAALEGQKGALLCVMSASDGKRLAGYKLDSPPVFDGMAAANGRLYLSTIDGKVLCMGKEGKPLPKATFAEPKLKKPDLVGYWKFDEGSGEITRDSSERCNDAEFSGEWVQGKSGYALHCDGEKNCVTARDTDSLNITDEITITAWIKPGDQSQPLPVIVFKGREGGRYLFSLVPKGFLNAVFWKDGRAVARIRSDQPISKEWHHVAVTYDPLKTQRLRLYADGQVIKEEVASENWGNPRGPALTISGRGGQAFTGIIDEVKIYNRALTPEEIKKYYDATK